MSNENLNITAPNRQDEIEKLSSDISTINSDISTINIELQKKTNLAQVKY